MAQRTDVELLSDAHEDHAAFAEFVTRHQLPLARYATRRLGPSMADDIVNETFTVAFLRRERFDPDRGEARVWLLGIATNLIRRHARQEAKTLRAYARSGVDPEPRPSLQESKSSRLRRLERCPHLRRSRCTIQAPLQQQDLKFFQDGPGTEFTVEPESIVRTIQASLGASTWSAYAGRTTTGRQAAWVPHNNGTPRRGHRSHLRPRRWHSAGSRKRRAGRQPNRRRVWSGSGRSVLKIWSFMEDHDMG